MYGILLKFNVVSGSRTTVKCRLVLHGCGLEFGFCHCINLHRPCVRSGVLNVRILLLLYWPDVDSSWTFLDYFFVAIAIAGGVGGLYCCSSFDFLLLNIQAKSFGPYNLHHQTYFPVDRINFIHILCIIVMISFPASNVYSILIKYCSIWWFLASQRERETKNVCERYGIWICYGATKIH